MHTAGLTPLVGRGHDLGLLLDCWEMAKSGEGQVVLLSGEPGIGKSRIVRELQEPAAGAFNRFGRDRAGHYARDAMIEELSKAGHDRVGLSVSGAGAMG
jgi:predicted ATPase